MREKMHLGESWKLLEQTGELTRRLRVPPLHPLTENELVLHRVFPADEFSDANLVPARLQKQSTRDVREM